MDDSDIFFLRAGHWQEIVAHLERCLPEEACGLIGGLENASAVVLPVTNRLHQPDRFRMDPQEQFNAFLFLEKSGFDLLAIFHSHPQGPGAPSPTDLDEFAYPGVLTLICMRAPGGWQARAFRIEGRNVDEVRLQICQSP